MKPFPVIWKVNNDLFTEIRGGYVPRTLYSARYNAVIKPGLMLNGLPPQNSIVMLHVTRDTARTYLSLSHDILRIYPIAKPDKDRTYPELHYVGGATKTTTRGAYSLTEVEGGKILSQSNTLSRTMMHGSLSWFVLLQPGESFTIHRYGRSNLGNDYDTRTKITYEGILSLDRHS